MRSISDIYISRLSMVPETPRVLGVGHFTRGTAVHEACAEGPGCLEATLLALCERLLVGTWDHVAHRFCGFKKI